MKKLLGILIALCLVVTMCAMLVACDDKGGDQGGAQNNTQNDNNQNNQNNQNNDQNNDQNNGDNNQGATHTHSFAAAWTSDETHHWKVCTGQGCTELSEKAEHTFDGGEITTLPSASADGVKTFTCTACGKTRTDSFSFSSLTEQEWEAMIAAANFENYTVYQKGTTNQGGYSYLQEMYVKFADDMCVVNMFMDGEPMADQCLTGSDAAEQKTIYEELFLTFLSDYANFVFDPADGSYKNPQSVSVTLSSQGYSFICVIENGKITFDESGRLLRLECDYSQSFAGAESPIAIVTDAVWEFSDYGTTVIPDPYVTEQKWSEALTLPDAYKMLLTVIDDDYAEIEVTVNGNVIKVGDDCYYEKNGENYFVYTFDGSVWTKAESDQASFESYTKPFNRFFDSFALFTYADNGAGYEAQGTVEGWKYIELYFADGKVIDALLMENEIRIYYEIEYVTVELTLPTV